MSRSFVYVFVIFAFIVGVSSFVHFSRDVRTVAAVGLFTSGLAIGSAVVRLALELRGKIKR
jgi:hypothetical protein